MNATTPLGTAVNFFFYDSIKIVILLFGISFVMGIINAYFPIERLRQYLATHKLYGLDYFMAALFGGITPFCSCSSVPLFIGFVKGGIPLGVTLAFLIASPLVSEIAVAMFLGSFGWEVTLVYIISGTVLSMVAGYILSRMHLEPYLSDWVKAAQAQSSEQSERWEAEKTPFIMMSSKVRVLPSHIILMSEVAVTPEVSLTTQESLMLQSSRTRIMKV